MAVAIAREKELGTLKELVASGYRSYQVVLGKMIPYFLINLISANLVLLLCFNLFQVPFRGSFLVLELLLVVFMLSILTIGIFLSLICKNELEATQIAMLVAYPPSFSPALPGRWKQCPWQPN
nr:ABC transporter permease [Desulforamulus aquiferis]